MAARRDGNEKSCMDEFRARGWSCLRISADGWTDWVCTRQGANTFQELWVEVKQPGERITKAQADFFPKMEAAGHVIVVVTTVEQAASVASSNGGGVNWRDLPVRQSSPKAKKSRPKLRIPKHLR